MHNTNNASIIDRFLDTLPDVPFCTDSLGYLMKRPKDIAKEKRYIQHNTRHDLYWFVYDVDRPTGCYDWQDFNAPVPNMTAMNPDNGHSHLYYGLETPVIRCEYNPLVHKKPIRYAGAVDVALTKKLQADQGYSGFICKNPLHKHWIVTNWNDKPYDLGGLSSHLDLSPYNDKRSRLPPIGLGRNCTLFELSRKWSYKEARQAGFLSIDFFVYSVISYALKHNSEFPKPLPHGEVRSIGKSIGKWIFRNMSHDGFIEWCRRRGKAGNLKSIEVRQAAAEIRNERILEYVMLNPTATYSEIAREFGVSEKTIKRLKLCA